MDLIENGGHGLVGANGQPIRAQPEVKATILVVEVERDGTLTFLAPDNMSDHNLETLTTAFFRWKQDYKRGRYQRDRQQLG